MASMGLLKAWGARDSETFECFISGVDNKTLRRGRGLCKTKWRCVQHLESSGLHIHKKTTRSWGGGSVYHTCLFLVE